VVSLAVISWDPDSFKILSKATIYARNQALY